MRIFILISLSYLVSVSSISLTDFLPQGNRWWVPNKDFNFIWVTRSAVQDELNSLQQKLDLITYHLFTKKNPDKDQQLRATDTTASNFNKKNPTRILIHGFRNTYKSDSLTKIRDALFKIGSYNVICVDWSSFTNRTYVTSRAAVPFVGDNVGLFIESLTSFRGMQLKDLKVIGHSLGAHVAGYAGKHMDKHEKLPYIIGLDPALPLFSYNDSTLRLCKSDAIQVETFQTNGGKLGFLKPIGNLVFYPNGGKSQPGCGLDLTGSCAHARAYIYFSEAGVKNDFPTIRCSSYMDAVANECGTSYSGVKMGSPDNEKVNGFFYVPVNSEPPYGKGEVGCSYSWFSNKCL